MKSWKEAMEQSQNSMAVTAPAMKTWADSLQQYQKFMEASAPYIKTWAESLEQYPKFMATGQSYLKPCTDFLEQYQKMTEIFSRPTIARPSNGTASITGFLPPLIENGRGRRSPGTCG